MPANPEMSARFLRLHQHDAPLLMPNAWDVGSAKVLASLGFDAVATTSSGFAATLGRLDGRATRDEVLAHAAAVAAAVEIPVSADFENAFADAPEQVAANVRLAIDTGLAGCSVEDWSGTELYDRGLATDRVAAACEAAHSEGSSFVITARAENFLHGNPDLDDTVARLRAFQDAGADVIFAPGIRDAEGIRAIVAAVACPVNVLAGPGTPPIAELAAIGVKRVSVGGAFAWVAYGAMVGAARELLDEGTFGYLADVAEALPIVRPALDA